MRGTPQQIIEKYQSLARDKATSGDRVLAEAFLQHAEHYLRILSASQPTRNEERQPVEERTEEPRADDGAVSSGELGADGMAVIGEEASQSPAMVDTPEAGAGGGRRRGRRPSRRVQHDDGAEKGADRGAEAAEPSGQSQDPANQEPGLPLESAETEVVVDAGSIRAAE